MPDVVVGSHRLFYEDQGTGKPLVLLSGLGGDSRAFGVTIRHFSARCRVLALDARDTGRSDRSREPFSTAELADDVAGWLDAIGLDSAWILGHSLGGLVAQELAIHRPDLVEGLILASTHAGVNEWRRAVIESWILARHVLSPGEFARSTLPWLAAPPFFRSKAQVEGLVRFAERNEWPQTPDAFERQARSAIEHDTRDRLGLVRAPTLVVVGELDLINPPSIAEELAVNIEAASLVVLPGVGHLPHIEDGPKFRETVGAFLDSQA